MSNHRVESPHDPNLHAISVNRWSAQEHARGSWGSCAVLGGLKWVTSLAAVLLSKTMVESRA
eukprot:1732920-Prymnesium_polylepis.1